MKTILKDALILFAITLVAGVLLAVVYEITLEPISVAQKNATNATYREVFPEAADFLSREDLAANIESCNADPELQNFGTGAVVYEVNAAADASGNPLGYVITTGGKGYGGEVRMTVGINNDSQITGLGFLKINETPGLGMNAKNDSFRSQFPGKSAADALELSSEASSDSEIQALSGATYTSKAVRTGVNAAVYFYNNYIE